MKVYNTYNWKGFFINDLIHDLNYSSYLELGVSVGDSWIEIFCENKNGVDFDSNVQLNFPEIICSTTDKYFETLTDETFNLVYVDAKHEKYQVCTEFYNIFPRLTDNGIIIFHDINPPDIRSVLPTNAGNVYEFWIELTKNFPNNTKTFISESNDYNLSENDTIGIFFKNGLTTIPNKSDFGVMDYSYEYFDKNREVYINNLHLDYENIIHYNKESK